MSFIEQIPDIIKKAEEEYKNCTAGAFKTIYRYGAGAGLNMAAEGDNLEFMKFLLQTMDMKGKLNLIYVDPPFFTKLKHEAVVKIPETGANISVPAYTDKWESGEVEYFRMLCARLIAMRQLLADDGCLWVHLDWHASHYIKIFLDEIFGADNFINEVIWTYKSGGSSKRHFSRKHDTLLFYSKTKNYYFKPQKEKSYNRGFKPYHFKGVEEFCDDNGWYTLVNMKDVWNIDMVGRTSSERTGYATQKPEALLERILESCSKEDDICADFFAGSGTLAAVADKMNRRFIICDGGDLAVSMCTERLAKMSTEFDVMSTSFETKQQIYGIEIDFDEKSGEYCINAEKYINLSEQSTDAVKFWSVDTDYDGLAHKADSIHFRNKSGIECVEKIKAGKNISIAFTGITGIRKQYVYCCDSIDKTR